MPEVLDRWLQSAMRLTRVGCPAQVKSYDPSTRKAVIEPLISDRYLDADGQPQNEIPPVLSGVPVDFPGGGGMFLAFPLQAGDTGWLTFADRSIDGWKSQGGPQAPNDGRRHSWADAKFEPGLRSFSNPPQTTDPNVTLIGQDGAAGDFVATAQRVLGQLNALANVFSEWTPVPNDGGAALKTLLTALLSGPPSWPAAPASSTVKVLG